VADDPFRIGAIPDLLCQPLVTELAGETYQRLRTNPSDSESPILFSSAGINAERVARKELDAALIGPIEYARNSSVISLYPSIGASSSGQSSTVILCLKQELRSISSIAVGNVSTSDVVLATIILSERYEQKCSIVPVAGDIHKMLEKSDAALLSGDTVLNTAWNGPVLDLVDEWTDMTDLPYIHLVCAGPKSMFNKRLSSLLNSSREIGTKALHSIAEKNSKRLNLSPEKLEEQLSKYEYNFDETSKESLNELFRYAFYLGIFPDIPEVEEFES
jgi:predicted solute-binding protein